MTSRQLLLIANQKKQHDSKYTNYKNKKSGKRGDTDKVLEEEHERFVKYVPMTFEEGEKVPVTDYEFREHIKKKFGKKRDLDFLMDNTNDDAYANLIKDLQNQEAYNQALARQKRWIKIHRKTKYGTNQRVGVPVNDKTYYIVVKAHTDKNGHRIQAQRRYYSVTTGKQISKGRLSRYVDLNTLGGIEMTRIERIKHLKDKDKEKSAFQRVSQRRKATERIKKLRGL